MDQRAAITRGTTLILGLGLLGYTLAEAGMVAWLSGAIGVLLVAMYRRVMPAVSGWVALGLMATVYGVSFGSEPSLGLCGLLCLMLIMGAGLSKRPLAAMGTIMGLGMSLMVLGWSLTRVGQHAAVGPLMRGASGLGAAALVWGLWHMAPWTPVPRRVSMKALEPARSPWVGRALVFLGLTLPMGEGVAWLAAAAVAVALGLHVKAYPAAKSALSLGWLAHPLALWAGCGLVAIGLGGYGWLDPGELGRWGPMVLLPLVLGACRVAGADWVGRAGLAFCVAMSLACVVGITQYALGHELVLWLRELTDWTLPLKGQLSRPAQPAHLVAGGFYGHRLKLAHVLVVGLGLLVTRQLFSRLERRGRIIELVIITVFAVTLGLTFARGAVLGLVAGMGVLWLFAPSRIRAVSLAVALLLTAGTMSQPEVRTRLSSILESSAIGDRAIIWTTALSALESSPAGVGLGNYSTLLGQLYQGLPEQARLPAEYAHHMVLSMWVEMGPIGLLSWCWFWWGLAGMFGGALWSLRQPPNVGDGAREAAALGLFVLITYWVIGFTHDVLYHKPVAMTFFAVLGACLARVGRSGDGADALLDVANRP